MVNEPSVVDWGRIENFVGFGRRDAPVVFIGMEEGLKSPDGLDADLAIRSTYEHPVMDLRDAHRGVVGSERRFDPERAQIQRTWRVMADLMLRRDGNAAPSTADRRRYQAVKLGRVDGDTLLTELLPYPSPGLGDWLYARFGEYPTREAYVSAMLPQRLNLLRDVLAAAPREPIVCYGKQAWTHYEDLFPESHWQDDGIFKNTQTATTRVVLTPHFTRPDFNSDDDLAQFAKVALRAVNE